MADNNVWLNALSHIMYCPGTRYYGKTNSGEYLTIEVARSRVGKPISTRSNAAKYKAAKRGGICI